MQIFLLFPPFLPLSREWSISLVYTWLRWHLVSEELLLAIPQIYLPNILLAMISACVYYITYSAAMCTFPYY